MHHLKNIFNKAKYGLLAGAMAASALGQAAPAAAQTVTAQINFDQANYNVASVAAGNSITVTVSANTNQIVRAWQFGVNYNPAVVTLTDVGGGAAGNVSYIDSFFTSQRPAGASITTVAGSIDNTTGSPSVGLSTGGDSYLGGAAGTGATGTGVLAVLHFHAVANGSTGLTFTGPSHLVDTANHAITTTLGTANVNVGPVAAPDLTVQTPNTVSTTTPAGGVFNVTFTIANIGSAAAGASHASVAVSNASPASLSVAIGNLAASANSGIQTVGPFTLASGQTLSSVTITADSAAEVAGNLRSAPTATTAYSFAAFTSNGQTPINANYGGFLRLTAPGLESTTFTAGQTNTFGGTSPLDDLNVRSNLSSWNVTIAGDNTGHFHEFDPGTSAYITTAGAAQLLSNIAARTVGPPAVPTVNVTGTPQQYVSGVRATSNPTTGNTYTVTYDQFVGFNDQPVNPPHVYHIVLTWAASGTF